MTPARQVDASYRILMREGCRLVYGHMPLSEFLNLVRQAHDRELLHPGLARMLEATAVIGPPEALARIRRQETPAAVERMRKQLGRAALLLDPHALRWLAAGEQGPASLALFALLTGVRPRYYRGKTTGDVPREANAFRRCRLLIEQVPALRRALPVLAERVAEPGIAEWAAIAEAWDDLCAQMDHEAPDWRLGPIRAQGVTAMLKCFRELETA
ncbi:hypothetical protein QTH97_23465 [Variovorax sp. J22R24]|uniref:hypothetical protein n=1 Tax=Variovorax gracilis TaxID=3053502 RepID=UPI0025773030|nr:hypothetical protein [Variovorax sp. J22R24]MDM0107926.1 hypothetical protein [Variovorax sp. J22R24]